MNSVMTKLSIDVILKIYEDPSANILFSLSWVVFLHVFLQEIIFMSLCLPGKKTQEDLEATLVFYCVQV